MCLDVLRALGKSKAKESKAGIEVLQDEWRSTRGNDRRLDRFAQSLESDLLELQEHESAARRLSERLALCLSASLLLQHAPSAVADAFCASRLDNDWSNAFGTLPVHTNFQAIIERGSLVQPTGKSHLVGMGEKT